MTNILILPYFFSDFFGPVLNVQEKYGVLFADYSKTIVSVFFPPSPVFFVKVHWLLCTWPSVFRLNCPFRLFSICRSFALHLQWLSTWDSEGMARNDRFLSPFNSRRHRSVTVEGPFEMSVNFPRLDSNEIVRETKRCRCKFFAATTVVEFANLLVTLLKCCSQNSQFCVTSFPHAISLPLTRVLKYFSRFSTA